MFSSKGGKNIVDDPMAALRQLNECLSAIFRMRDDLHKTEVFQSGTRAACTGLDQTETVPEYLHRHTIRVRPNVEQEAIRVSGQKPKTVRFVALRIPENQQCI